MYIINPWFFYLVDVIPKIRTTLFAVSIAAMALLLLIMAALATDNEDISIPKKHFLFSIIIFIISILIPTKETIYKMAIASITTTENVKIAVNESKELYNFLKDEIADAAKFIIDYQKREGEKENDSN